LVPRRVLPCVEDLPDEQIVYLALGEDEPVERLTGWHDPEVGPVGLLVVVEDGLLLPAWRISSVTVPVWAALAAGPTGEVKATPPARPLPGAVLWVEDRLVSASGTVPASELPRWPRPPRFDVLVHPSAAPTVGALLDRCAEATAAQPLSTRCILATGDPERWARVLLPPAVPGVEPLEIELIEEEWPADEAVP
jgi:hypothetical protein